LKIDIVPISMKFDEIHEVMVIRPFMEVI